MIPISDTPHKNLQKEDNELWHIIEEQRNVIQELQKALKDMTVERDALQAQLNCTTNNPITSNTTTPSSSSISSYVEENCKTTQPQQQQQLTNLNSKNPLKPSDNNKLPVPPPRSPYRSNTQIDTLQKKSSSKKRTDTRHSSLPNLQQDDDRDQVFDYESDNVINIQVNVKAILASSIILSIINISSGKEIWKVGKSYTDLLTLDIAVSSQSKIPCYIINFIYSLKININ